MANLLSSIAGRFKRTRTEKVNTPAILLDAVSDEAIKDAVASLLKDDLFLKDGITGVTWDGDVGWMGMGGGRLTNRSPNSDIDWEGDAGTPWCNSVTSLCIQYIYNKIIEPRVHVVYEDGEGMLQPIPKHPASELLLNPNPEYSGNALIAGMCLSYAIDGNAYCRKVRGGGGAGVPVELWWIPHWRIAPLPPPNGGPSEFYVYQQPTPTGGSKAVLIPRRDIIHVRNGIDPDNPRLGFRQLKAQLRGIVSDNEIDTVVAVTLRNFGIIGTLVSPKSSDLKDQIPKDVMEKIVRRIRNASGGDSRGGIVGIPVPVDVNQAGKSPEEMMVNQAGDRPQARICAAFNIDPAAIGLLSVGGKGEKYGSMRKEARAASYENCILPLLAALSERWTYDLLPDFGANPNGYWIEYDYTRVRDLQENKDASDKRAIDGWDAGLATLDEGRMGLGLRSCKQPEIGEKFKWQLLPAPNGDFGVIGVPGGPSDAQTPRTPDPDEQDLTEEDDEDLEGDGADSQD